MLLAEMFCEEDGVRVDVPFLPLPIVVDPVDFRATVNAVTRLATNRAAFGWRSLERLRVLDVPFDI